MPLEIPKSAVQHLHHRASGFSIRAKLRCLLAVVLGLFAHQGALAQTHTLDSLVVAAVDRGGATVTETTALAPAFPTSANAFTITFPFDATRVTVTAAGTADWTLTVPGVDDADLATGYEHALTSRTNSITVRATEDGGSGTRNYTITVTRAAQIGSALSALSVSPASGITGTVDALDPAFPPTTDTADPRAFRAKADLSVTRVTVTATTNPGWEAAVTYHDDPDADTGTDGYQRNLTVGTNRIRVRATQIGISGTRDYTITVTRTTTPGAPRNLRATAADRSVRLSWTAPSSDGGRDITGYEYRSKDADEDDGQWMNDDAWSAISGSDDSTTSHDVDGLTNGTTYIFQVRAMNANTLGTDPDSPKGSASNTAEATPARPLPAPVWTTDPPAVVEGNRRVTLSWTRIPDATTPDDDDASVTGYEYRRRVDGGSYGGWTTIPDGDLVESADTRSYTVTGLTNGTTYFFQVRGRSSAGAGAASTAREATPEASAPGAPTNLRATAGNKQVTLSWTAPSDDGGEPITGYEYRYRGGSITAYPDAWTATGGTGTTATVHELTNGTTYYFQVRAVNDLGCGTGGMDGCGLESLEVSATPAGTPDTLVSLTATPHQDRRVTLGWTLLTDAGDHSGFQYQQKTGGGYGRWIDVRNSDASTDEHVVGGLTNGTTYTFRVRAVNSSGGGLDSNEASAVPSTTPGVSTLTATAGDKEVSLTWTPASDGGRRIIGYECQMRTGAVGYPDTVTPSCAGKSLGPSATSLTLTGDDGIVNGSTYTFQVRAVNGNGSGDWSNAASARPTDGSGRSFTISATIDGKSWAKVITSPDTHPLRATVEVNPRYREQNTPLWVNVEGGGVSVSGVDEDGGATTGGTTVNFGSADSRRDASFTVTPTLAGDITIALFTSKTAAGIPSNALAVTSVEVRPTSTPDPPAGLVATRGDGEVTLSWATPPPIAGHSYDYDYRQRRQPGSYGRWTDFARDELQGGTVTSNTVTGFTDGGTYGFQVRAVAVDDTDESSRAESDPSDEVTVSLSGTVDTGGLSAPRNFSAAPGNGQVTLSWTAPASDGGAAISGYQYQQKAGTGAYGAWTNIPGSGPSTRSHIVTGLTNGTGYFFRVRAVNRDGEGPPSNEESATPSPTVDTTLRGLSLSTVTLSPVTVALSPAFTPATRTYTAAVGSSVAQVTVAATPNKAGATATITPADANTTAAGHQVALAVGPNAIRVRVADGTNAGVYSITVTRAGSAPAAPTGLAATAGEGAVTLSWTAPTGGGAVSGYEYQQKAGTGAYGAWTPIPGSGPSTTSYTVTGLTNGTAYAFRVRALNSTGAGAASNEVTVTPTGRLVWANSEQEVAAVIAAAIAAGAGDDMTLDVGDQIEILGSALFNAAEGVTLSYTAVSSDSDVASAGIIDTVTATVLARAGGMADITITATATTASPPPSGVTINPQTNPREASITFPVEVDIEALALELVGPTDMNLVEGGRDHANGTAGRATVTVRANRPVTREVTVTLMADRAMSDATADDFEAAPIVLGAGATAGSTLVTAVEDNTAEGREELVLFGVAADNAGEVTGEVTLHLWDAAVPALPVIAQLLLAALLLWASGRRYRLRR